MAKIPPYVFRGTTINFEGGSSCQKCGYTPTTKHPVKATLFALECAQRYPEKAVIYIFKTERLKNIEPLGNVLKKHEEELAWPILPKDIYKLSEGYVHVINMKQVLNNHGILID